MINLLIYSVIVSVLLIIFLQKIKAQFIKNTFLTMIVIFLVNFIYFLFFYKTSFLKLLMYINILILFNLILIIVLQSYNSSIQLVILKEKIKKINFTKKDQIIFNNRLVNLSKNGIISIQNNNVYIKNKHILFVVFFFIVLRKIYKINFKN
jgi:hypothetical protein